MARMVTARSTALISRVSTSTGTLIGLLFVAAVVFVAASAAFYVRDRHAAEVAAEHDLRQVADTTSEELVAWFKGRILLVQLVNDMMSQMDGKAVREHVIRNQTINRSFEEIYFADQNDGSFARSQSVERLPPGYNVRQRPWYTAAVQRGSALLTDPYVSAGDRGQVITIAVPLVRQGKLLGVTGSDFRLATMVQILEGRRVVPGSSFFIVNAAGRILLHANPKHVGQSLGTVFGQNVRIQGNVVQRLTRDGQTYLVAFHPLEGLPARQPWYVGVAIDAEAATAPAMEAFVRSAIMTGIIVFALIGGFLAILQILIRRPLTRLTRSISETAAGHFESDIPFVGHANEIGDVARAIAIFRNNGREVERLRSMEAIRVARDAETRAAMMNQLKAEFGQVVDAASKGDLDRRVTVSFPDPELQSLASSVNLLIETISRGLGEACAVLTAIGKADLTKRVTGNYSGAFATIKRDSNAVADRLGDVICQIGDTSADLRTGLMDLTTGTQQLAIRAAEQAISAQRTSGEVRSCAQIAVAHAADAEAASIQARDATKAGENGRRAMRAASDAMTRITETSTRVVQIADLLDGIARQTSIVALNASIEARRAGSSGQPFEVVAEEVRRLAKHAKAASQDVKLTVGTAIDEVASGTRLVDLVEVELMAMLRALEQNSQLLVGITTASRRQAELIDAIGGTVADFDRTTSDNLALADRLQKFARTADHRAGELDAIVNSFALA